MEVAAVVKRLISAGIIEIFLFLLISGVFIVPTFCFPPFLTSSIFFDFGFIFRFLLTSELFFTGEIGSAGRGNNTKLWELVFCLPPNGIGEPRRLTLGLGFLSPIRFFSVLAVFLGGRIISGRAIVSRIKRGNIGRELIWTLNESSFPCIRYCNQTEFFNAGKFFIRHFRRYRYLNIRLKNRGRNFIFYAALL